MSEEKQQSLADFIEAHHKLLTVLGVMVALSVYAQGLRDKFFAANLSFLFLSCAVLVFIEILSQFEKAKAWRLDWFETMTVLALGLLTLYWLINLRLTFAASGVQMFVLFLTMAALVALLRVSKLMQWLSRFAFLRRRGIREAVNALVFAALVAGSYAVTSRVSPTMAKVLHGMAADTSTVVPKQ